MISEAVKSFKINRLFYLIGAILFASSYIAQSAHAVSVEEDFHMQQKIEFSARCSISGSSGGEEETNSEPTSSGAVDESGWAFPTAAGTPISSGYQDPSRSGHRGVDLANSLGTPIYASREGVVTNSGTASGFGNWIVIQHDVDGKRVDSVYGHMKAEDLMVKTGDKVKTGQQISRIGSEGQSSGPHLHYEEWEGGRGSGGDRKPVAVYGQTGNTTPADPKDEQVAAQTENEPSATATSDEIDSCKGKDGTEAPVTPVNCAEANKSEDKSKFVWDYLRGQGLTEEQTAGVMGNLAHESGDPTFKKATDAYEVGGANAGYGLAQWSFGRQDSLRDAGAKDPRGVSDLCFQLDYLVEESKGRERRDGGGNEWDGIKEQKTIEDATYYFEYNYERPKPGSTAARVKYAKEYMAKYGSGGRA